MKYLIALMLVTPFTAMSSPLNSIEQAQVIQEHLLYLLDAPGVTSIGIGGCNPQTGLEGKNSSGGFVFCVIVLADGPTSTKRILKTFPPRTQLGGIIVHVKAGSKVDPQPRMSGGS